MPDTSYLAVNTVRVNLLLCLTSVDNAGGVLCIATDVLLPMRYPQIDPPTVFYISHTQ